MKCTNCGFENINDAIFCEKCGVKMVDDKPKISIDTIKKAVGDFKEKEKKLLIICLALIVATPLLCGIINKVDSFVERKAYEKEHSTTSNDYDDSFASENMTNGFYQVESTTEETTIPLKTVTSENYAKEVINALVNRDVNKFYSFIDTSDEEVKYLLDRNIMQSVLDFVFLNCTYDGNMVLTDFTDWRFDGGMTEEYCFNVIMNTGETKSFNIRVISYEDRNVFDIWSLIETKEFYLPSCANVSMFGNVLTGIAEAEEGNKKIYNKYMISYLNFAEGLPFTVYVPGMSQSSTLIFDEQMYELSMYSIASLDKNRVFFDELLTISVPQKILSSMIGNTLPVEQYALPSDVAKDETIVEGENFGENIYGDMYYYVGGDENKTFGEIKEYSIVDYDLRNDGYLYLEVSVEYSYSYISFDELVEDTSYATFRYKYMNEQWYLTSSDGSIGEGV